MIRTRSLLALLTSALPIGASLWAVPACGEVRPAPAATLVVDVREFGARGDGMTDDSSSFRAAQAAITKAGGGTIHVPRTKRGYVIGDTHLRGTGLQVTDRTTWQGDGALLLHRARNDLGQNHLFTIQDASGVAIRGFEITGEGRVAMAVSMKGLVRDVALEDLVIHDMKNFAITYGSRDTNPDTSNFSNLAFRRIRIFGVCGKTGDGSGINIFPRSERDGEPVSHGVTMTDLDIDVTQGQSRIKKHGPQGLKFNNVSGVHLERVSIRGGEIGGVTIGNGTRDVTVVDLKVTEANRGITIHDRHNIATTKTQNIAIERFRFTAARGRSDRLGVLVWGGIPRLRFSDLDLEGDFAVRAETPEDTLEDLVVSGLTLRSARFLIEEPLTPTRPVKRLKVNGLRLFGTPRGAGPRVQLGGANREVEGSVVEDVAIDNARAGDVVVRGRNNYLKGLRGEGNDRRLATSLLVTVNKKAGNAVAE